MHAWPAPWLGTSAVLADAGRFVQLGRCGPPDASVPMYFMTVRRKDEHRVTVSFYGASVPEAAGKAAEWAREGTADDQARE